MAEEVSTQQAGIAHFLAIGQGELTVKFPAKKQHARLNAEAHLLLTKAAPDLALAEGGGGIHPVFELRMLGIQEFEFEVLYAIPLHNLNTVTVNRRQRCTGIDFARKIRYLKFRYVELVNATDDLVGNFAHCGVSVSNLGKERNNALHFASGPGRQAQVGRHPLPGQVVSGNTDHGSIISGIAQGRYVQAPALRFRAMGKFFAQRGVG